MLSQAYNKTEIFNVVNYLQQSFDCSNERSEPKL